MKSVTKYLLITFLFTWLLQIPVVLDSQKIISLPFSPLILLLFGSFGPSLCGIFLTWRKDGFQSVRQLFRDGFNLRISWQIYLFIAIVPLGMSLLAHLIAGGTEFNFNILTFLGTFILYFFLGGSFNEEFGWRGYMLPRLFKNYSVLTATLLVGIFWSVWHLPMFWMIGTSQYKTPIWLFVVGTTAAAVKYTWVYLRTNGNLFACLLLHTFTNITVVVFPIEVSDGIDNRVYYETLFEVVLAVILIAVAYKKMRENVT